MIITHFGREHFKLQVGELTIAINPVSKDGKGKVAKYGADVTLITTNHPDYNGEDQTAHGEKTPFVIKGAGEYEVKDIFIKGFSTETELKEGKVIKKYQNTSYVFTLDGIRVTFLGALSSRKGVGIGSPRKDVLAAYGKLRDPEDPSGDQADVFIAGSIYGGVFFTMVADKVSEIFIGAGAE